MIPKPLPLSVADLSKLTWPEIAYGYSQRFIGWKTPVGIAIQRVEQGSSDETEVELAAIGKDEAGGVGEVVSRLAAKAPTESDTDTKKNWLFVILNWLYKNRDSFQDPLQEVEEIYADFGYPEEIEQLVRFLPPKDGYRPDLHSREDNLRRLYALWAEYLETARMATNSKTRRSLSRSRSET